MPRIVWQNLNLTWLAAGVVIAIPQALLPAPICPLYTYDAEAVAQAEATIAERRLRALCWYDDAGRLTSEQVVPLPAPTLAPVNARAV